MWPLFISLRYLVSKRGQQFISVINVISVAGVTLGVAALIVVLSVMTGFDDEIKEKIIGTYSHIIVTSDSGIEDAEGLVRRIVKNRAVIAADKFIERQALIKTGGNVTGILLRGIESRKTSYTTNIRDFTSKHALDFGKNNIILGSELKRRLNLAVGDKLTLIAPETEIAEEYVISDTFTSGRYDYDANIAFISLDRAKTIFKTKSITAIGLKVRNEYEVMSIRNQLQKDLGYAYTVKSWMDIDKNLMKALAMEKKMMFLILGLIVIVACFNISGSLIMMVMEKTKDIGILRSLGARASDVGIIFLLNGFFVGLIGAVLGVSLGVSIALNINNIADSIERVTGFEFFPSDIYYLSSIPSRICMTDVAGIFVFAILLALVSGLYPAIQAARLEPVDAIRYG